MTEKHTSWLFRGAAIYGAILLLPVYFLEGRVAAPAVRLSAPEYFYGFVGAALSFQILYWIVGGAPRKYHALMLLGVVAKLSFWIPTAILWGMGRTATSTFALVCGDLVLAIAFFVAWMSLRSGD
ncbi:MAG: hypothetical protein E7773_08610 [Sphingomonas sp.]|uniref:hypothetical protein n=1 Tax=Sphingomonas sp. TaxID=28214 RepID=UPI00121D7F7B|nr:hypothetical protein [Sphingomonas sp.]THD35996.1 MAG: hypothetical protein E7773_08610 [Sphingomonas sp.]